MYEANRRNIDIEGAQIKFRNFSGRESKFNRAGDRNFCLVISDPALLDRMQHEGYNIKQLGPNLDDRGNPIDDPVYYIQVKVRFDNFPPKVILVTRRNQVRLNESTIDQLDYVEIANIDMTISPYNWEMNGRTGTSAYLKTMYITIEEDAFEEKYAEYEHPMDDDELPFN